MVTEKNMSFLSEDEEIMIKYTKIWKNMTKKYGFKLDSQSGYDNRYIKTNLKTYDKTNCVFTDNEIPKEKTHYSCIAVIYFDSVLTINEENCPQVYLEQCKY